MRRPSPRLRGPGRDAGPVHRPGVFGTCRHTGRAQGRQHRRARSWRCTAGRPAVPVGGAGAGPEERRRRRALDGFLRRPSMPPDCTKPRPRRAHCRGPLPGFGVVCALSGVLWVVALVLAAMARGPL